MITNIISPFQSTALAAAQGQAAPQTAVAPADTAVLGATESTSGMSGMKKAAMALMLGVTAVGGGLLTPTTANAQPMYRPGYSQPMNYGYGHHHGGHHGGNNVGEAIAGGIIGGILGGIIGGAIGGAVPAPMPPPMPMPPPVGYGYDGYGCDGVYHHFDNYGNVADMSGHYRLQQGPYGQCYRTAPYPY